MSRPRLIETIAPYSRVDTCRPPNRRSASGASDREKVDELEQSRGVPVDLVEPTPCARSRVVRQRPCALRAESVDEPVPVEDVVDDLEEEAELLAERPPPGLLRLGHARSLESQPHSGREQTTCLEPVELRQVSVVTGDVSVLAANHAERRRRELARGPRTLVRERQSERFAKERIAREDRGALSECHVRARAAPPKVVVVHSGEVVVDERERVDQLDRGRRRQGVLDGTAHRVRDGERENRPDALSARPEGVAKRLFQPAELRRQTQVVEVLVDEPPQLVEAMERHRRAPSPSRARPRSASRAPPPRR